MAYVPGWGTKQTHVEGCALYPGNLLQLGTYVIVFKIPSGYSIRFSSIGPSEIFSTFYFETTRTVIKQ